MSEKGRSGDVGIQLDASAARKNETHFVDRSCLFRPAPESRLGNSLNADAQISRFQPLAQVLDFIQLPGSATFIFPGRLANFQHQSASDVAKSTEQHITFFGSQFELKQSVHHA
jgi:hypothetical protein